MLKKRVTLFTTLMFILGSILLQSNEVAHAKSSISQIAAGYSHTLVVTNKGETVWAFGNNNFGQLGIGTREHTHEPTIIKKLSDLSDDIEKVAVGKYHSVALTDDNEAWSWGMNYYGQLGLGKNGDGYTVDELVPKRIDIDSDDDEIIDIAAGDFHTLALTEDGSVWSWGRNNFGQLGLSTTGNKDSPVKIKELDDVEQIIAYGSHSLALTEDGSVYSWGENWGGVLGNNISMTNQPTQIEGLDNIIEIDSGKYHVVALKEDGTVWTIGSNYFGQSNADEESPQAKQVKGLTNIVSIAAGDQHNLALKEDGTVWAWGQNIYGEIGSGTNNHQIIPIQVKNLNNVKKIEAGQSYSLAITEDDQIWTWGLNNFGQIGFFDKANVTNPRPLTLIDDDEYDYEDNDDEDEDLEIQLSSSYLTLDEGETRKLSVEIEPDDDDVDDLEWGSEERWIADVDQSGWVTAKSEGKTEIWVKVYANGEVYKDSTTVKVNESENRSIDIIINEKETYDRYWVPVEKEIELEASIFPDRNNGERVSWQSSSSYHTAIDPSLYGTKAEVTVLHYSSSPIKITAKSNDDDELKDDISLYPFKWKELQQATSTSKWKSWKVTFNQTLNVDTVTEHTVYVTDEKGNIVDTSPYIPRNNKKVIKVIPHQTYDYNQTYYLYIDKNIQTLDGQYIQNGIKMPFTITN